METKMNILFIGKKSRITTQKLLPIYLRVTIEGKRFEVATPTVQFSNHFIPDLTRLANLLTGGSLV